MRIPFLMNEFWKVQRACELEKVNKMKSKLAMKKLHELNVVDQQSQAAFLQQMAVNLDCLAKQQRSDSAEEFSKDAIRKQITKLDQSKLKKKFASRSRNKTINTESVIRTSQPSTLMKNFPFSPKQTEILSDESTTSVNSLLKHTDIK